MAWHENFTGVGLAVLEKAEVISPIIDSNGTPTSAGTVSAGYQNFLICIEMFCAAIALRYAFPYRVYAQGCVTDSRGRTVTMQSISSSLKVCKSLVVNVVNNEVYLCFNRKLWIRRILWQMPFTISILSINSILSIVQVNFSCINESLSVAWLVLNGELVYRVFSNSLSVFFKFLDHKWH